MMVPASYNDVLRTEITQIHSNHTSLAKMDIIAEHNKRWDFFKQINGIAMKVYNGYYYGVLESAYEAALCFLL